MEGGVKCHDLKLQCFLYIVKLQDIILREKYHSLIPKYIIQKNTKEGLKPFAICDCECGKKDVEIVAWNIGKTKSCGCSYIDAKRRKRKLYFKHNLGERIIKDDKDITILARKVTHYTKHKKEYKKYYKIKCNKCGFDSNKSCYKNGKYIKEYWIPEYGKMTCPCCCNPSKVVQLGINSIYDTNQWMVKYFDDKEIPKQITAQSNKKSNMTCPICKIKKNKRVNDLYKNKSFGSCKCQGKGKSFYELYFLDICEQLSEQHGYIYDTEISPIWCKFKNYYDETIRQGKYDYQPDISRNIFVELDGDFHRENNRRSGQTLEESKYIDEQKDFLAKNNGYINLRVICDSHNNIKNRILESEIGKYFDLSNIDWNRALEFAESKLLGDIILDKNNGLSIKEISEKYHISVDMVRHKVKIGVQLGKCEYNPTEENKKIFSMCGKQNSWALIPGNNKKQVEISCDKINWDRYESCQELIDISEEKYGHKFVASCISRVCNGTRNMYFRYYFRFVK